MKITLYQIDAFTEKVFSGNPAAVCILNTWIEAALMQQIAAENNLSETAFAFKKEDTFEIRWFTPTVEIDLCGHATLATAYVLFNYFETKADTLKFHSHRSGILFVDVDENRNLILDFPIDTVKTVETNKALNDALGNTPQQTYKTTSDYLVTFSSQKEIEALNPDLSALSKIDTRGVMVTAPGDSVDFVSRFFAPGSGIDEDPVTGSAHCSLIPFWSEKLNKTKLTAKQVSKRGGDLNCQLIGNRVKIAGKCCLYMIGEIQL